MYTRKAYETREAPRRGQRRPTGRPRGTGWAPWGGGGMATLQRIEQNEGVVKGNFSTILKIQKVLEQAGIHFTDDEAGEIGVRLQTRER
jgi:hypothetical protein